MNNNVTNCSSCGVGLDYEYSKRPSSAEVDHVTPHSRGGTDTLDNTAVICRWCNQRKGNGRKLTVPKPRIVEPGTRVKW
ncbi:HNH endonuclease [Brachybacterium alimentarium]|uniref:HNH endonuclease n=1 Tax=Brachybacterium alimentarium TaxID=47845 RepID=UPI003FCFD0A2